MTDRYLPLEAPTFPRTSPFERSLVVKAGYGNEARCSPTTKAIVVTGALLIVGCSGHPILGQWSCDTVVENREPLTVSVEHKIDFAEGGIQVTQLDFHYEFYGVGELWGTTIDEGKWEVNGDVLTIVSGPPKLLRYETALDITRETIAENLAEQFPAGRVSNTQFQFVGSDRMEMLDLDDGEEYSCESQSLK